MKKLFDMQGERLLTGVGFGDDPTLSGIPRLIGDEGGGNLMAFILDGTRFVVREDPSDGLRSSSKDVLIDEDGKLKNMFSPVKVKVCRADASRWDNPEKEFDEDGGFQGLLEFRCPWTNDIIVEVGTNRGDEWYPKFVSHFSPEKMAVAASMTQKELLSKRVEGLDVSPASRKGL